MNRTLVFALILALGISACSCSGSSNSSGGDVGGDQSEVDDASGGATLKVESPVEGAVFPAGEAVPFEIHTTCVACTLIARSQTAGTLFETRPSADGGLYVQVEDMSPGPHQVTVTLVHPEGYELKSVLRNLRINRVPGAPVVRLEPAAPTTVQDLTVAFDSYAVDPDQDPINYRYRWSRNGDLVAESAKGTWAATETARGQTWTVAVVPLDPYGEGQVATASVTVVNSAPSLQGATLLPSAGTVLSDFACGPLGWEDPDEGDPQNPRYAFLVNDLIVAEDQSEPEFPTGFAKGARLRCRITPGDDELFGEAVESGEVLVANSAPSVAEVRLSPAAGDVTDTFRCDVEAEDISDADDDPVELRYTWLIDAEALPGETSPELDGALFARGVSLRCSVTPFDGAAEGAPKLSEAVVLGDAAPVVGAVLLTPAEAFEDSQLSCEASAISDPDEDVVSLSYAWTLDGAPLPGETSATLTGDSFDKGDTVTCLVTPSALGLSGEPVEAKPAVTIQNTPPSLGPTLLEPAEGGRLTSFHCTKGAFTDPDPADDPIQWLLVADPDDSTLPGYTIRWRLDDVLLPTAGDETLLPDMASPGQRLRCEVIVTDGQTSSELMVSPEVVIDNAPPTLTAVSLSPETATEETVLVCSAEGFADAEDDAGGVRITWFVNGLPLTELDGNSSQLDGEHFDESDQVSCRATPHDAYDDGESLDSATVTIDNATPTVVSAGIVPESGGVGTNFSCLPEELDDPDPGEIAIALYRWYRNDELVPGAEMATWTPSPGAVGDAIRCAVIPFDGEDQGAPADSPVVVLQNQPPMLAGASLAPTPLKTGDEVTCQTTGFVDPEGADPFYVFAWSVAGAPVAGAVDQHLPAEKHARGQEVRCIVTPWDAEPESPGALAGEPVASAALLVTNTAPTITGLVLGPGEADETSVLSCAVEGFQDDDGDADASLFEWTVAGEIIPEALGATLNGVFFDEGDAVSCRVTPYDGIDEGAIRSAGPVTIGNAAPAAIGVRLSPDAGGVGTAFTCVYDELTDPDKADGVLPRFAWYLNGLLQPDSSPGYAPQGTSPGDLLSCAVTPFDGQDEGDQVISAPVALANLPPSLASVDIEPGAGEADTSSTLRCVPEGYDDPEGMDPDYVYQWFLDDAPIPGAVTNSLASGTPRGAVLRCQITPGDGVLQGDPVLSPPRVLDNASPWYGEVRVSPDAGDVSADYSCLFSEPQDPDGDPVALAQVRWLADGAVIDGATEETVPGSSFAKGQSVTCEVVANDGFEDGPASPSAPVVIADAPPSLADVSLTPAAPAEADTLICTPGAALDLDEETVALTFAWTVNDVPVTNAEANWLDGARFDKGDEVRCLVTPRAAGVNGSTVPSASLTILNTAPTIAAPGLSPDVGGRETNFTCSPGAITDPDPLDDPSSWNEPGHEDPADSETPGLRYQWWLDGAEIPGAQAATFEPSDAIPGQELQCAVQASDGETRSPLAASAAVTLGNEAPSVNAVLLSPAEADEAVVVSCAAQGWSDPEGDPDLSTIVWLLNGQEIGGQTAATIDGAFFDRGDSLRCRVTPYDGYDEGLAVTSAALTIGNAAPLVGSVTLSPGTGSSLTVFHCEATGLTDPDAGDVAVPLYRWSVNGQPIDGAGQSAYQPDTVTPGDELRCLVRATDGDRQGIEIASNPATLVNEAPTASSVHIEPAILKADSEPRCVAEGFTDPEGVDEAYRYAWYLDSVLLETATGEYLDSGLFARDAEIFCIATPFDGVVEGQPLVSDAVSVVNSVPGDFTVSIDPPAPLSTDGELRCALDATPLDADGDELSWTWRWEDEEGTLLGSEETVATSALTPCTVLSCYAEANDGFEGATEALSEPEILDGSFGLAFDGIDDYVEATGDAMLNSAAFTLETWIQLDSVGALGTVAARGPAGGIGFTLAVEEDGRLRFDIKSSATALSLYANAPLSSSEWLHVAAQTDGAKAQLYVQGVQHDSGSLSGGLTTIGPLVIGARYSGVTYVEPLHGRLDELRLSQVARYSDSFTPMPAPATDDDTLLLYRFEGGAPGTVLDSSAAGLDGSAHGSARAGGLCFPTGQANQPPLAPIVLVSPITPAVNVGLACVNFVDSFDPEGQSVSHRVEWFRNGQPLPAGDGQWNLDASHTDYCDVMVCRVTGNDGVVDGSWGEKSAKVEPAPTEDVFKYHGWQGVPEEGIEEMPGGSQLWKSGSQYGQNFSFDSAVSVLGVRVYHAAANGGQLRAYQTNPDGSPGALLVDWNVSVATPESGWNEMRFATPKTVDYDISIGWLFIGSSNLRRVYFDADGANADTVNWMRMSGGSDVDPTSYDITGDFLIELILQGEGDGTCE